MVQDHPNEHGMSFLFAEHPLSGLSLCQVSPHYTLAEFMYWLQFTYLLAANLDPKNSSINNNPLNSSFWGGSSQSPCQVNRAEILHILQKRKLKGLRLPKPSQRLQWMRASLELKGSHPDKETDEPVVL